MTIITETHEEWHERLKVERNALRKGIFAYSPDPIVFGPSRMRFPDVTMENYPFFEVDDRYYIDTYRRCDYPDFCS